MPDDSALLAHAKIYDPVKAREYYLRTRKLKGRRAGDRQGSIPRVAGPLKDQKPKPAVSTNRPTREQQEARLKELIGRLEKLKKLLKSKVEAAQARSGVKDNSKEKQTKRTEAESKDDDRTSPADKQKAAKGGSPKSTAQQRRKDAKRARDNYEKKSKTPSKSEPSVQQEIEAVQRQIKAVEEQLREAVARARRNASDKSKSKSKTASKGR